MVPMATGSPPKVTVPWTRALPWLGSAQPTSKANVIVKPGVYDDMFMIRPESVSDFRGPLPLAPGVPVAASSASNDAVSASLRHRDQVADKSVHVQGHVPIALDSGVPAPFSGETVCPCCQSP